MRCILIKKEAPESSGGGPLHPPAYTFLSRSCRLDMPRLDVLQPLSQPPQPRSSFCSLQF